MSEIEALIDQLNRAFREKAWHGPSALESLQGITAIQASKRPIESAHTVWELVLHIGAWKSIVRQRILGNVEEVTPEQDFPPVGETTEDTWKTALARLNQAHEELIEAVRSLTPEALHTTIKGGKTDHYFQIFGIIQHDVYHAGQIVIIRKAL